jgi:hypothetical protein
MPGPTIWFDDVEISRRFVAATGATTAALDTDIPGYKPAWRIDYTMSYDRTLTATKFSGNDIASSSFDDHNGVPRRRLAERRELAKRVNRW